tara:strand:- start:305 stop:1753 length:1449 start_codon:yes stop_codon:yes gene_type:complete
MNKKTLLGIFILYFLVLLFQSSTYNFETLDWDINAFLVTSLELGRGNLPFENQYENKPPLLFAIFYFFSVIANKNLLIIKILNDIIIFLIAIQSVFLFTKKKANPKIFNFVPSTVFILVTSNVWFHPSYSEFISLFCITSSYLIYKRSENKNKFLFMGMLLSASSLINLGTSIFLICFGIIFILYEDKKIYSIFNLFLGFGIIHLIFLSFYIIDGSLNEYLMAMFDIPVSYGTTDFSLTSSLTVFLSSFVNYSLPIYILILISISLFIHMILKMIRKGTFKFDNSELIFLIFFGVAFFNLAGKGYYHHLIFLLYFLSLSFIFFQNKSIKKVVVFFILLITSFTIPKFVGSSFNNIKNFSTLNEQYPMKKVSDEIILNNYEYDEIFSSNYILILYYLDKPNASYIVHPALYDYKEITSILLRNKKIKENEIVYQINNMPKIFEGYDEEIINDSDYFKFEVPKIDNSLLDYWGKDNNVFVFIKK